MKNLAKLLALGRAHEKQRDAELKLAALRKAIAAKYNNSRAFWSSSSRNDQELCLSLALPVYLEYFQDEKPELRAWTSDHDGAKWATMEYPRKFVGWLRPGFALWVETSTPAIITQPAPATPEAVQAAIYRGDLQTTDADTVETMAQQG